MREDTDMREKKPGQANRRAAKGIPGAGWKVASKQVCPPGERFPGKRGTEGLLDMSEYLRKIS